VLTHFLCILTSKLIIYNLDTPKHPFHDQAGGVFMSKLHNKPVEVRMAGDTLTAFLWRGRWLLIEMLEKVERRGSLWELPPGDTYRVKVQGGGLYDLVRGRCVGLILRQFYIIIEYI